MATATEGAATGASLGRRGARPAPGFKKKEKRERKFFSRKMGKRGGHRNGGEGLNGGGGARPLPLKKEKKERGEKRKGKNDCCNGSGGVATGAGGWGAPDLPLAFKKREIRRNGGELKGKRGERKMAVAMAAVAKGGKWPSNSGSGPVSSTTLLLLLPPPHPRCHHHQPIPAALLGLAPHCRHHGGK